MMQSGQTHGAREEILERVRAAVKETAPRRETAPEAAIFPPITDPMDRFLAECAANYMEVITTSSPTETANALREVLSSLPAGEIFFQDTPELRSLAMEAAADREVRWSSEGPPAESSQATVSRCEALVALTGSLLVASGSCGGRGASIVAPCHIVLARADQLVPDLESALARAREIAFDHSYVGLITGCSRTSDIEKLLVIGAHGPRRLVVIVQK
jgi:L-lactate dehydrogenase complex protein LldG